MKEIGIFFMIFKQDAHRLELEELIERYETDIYTGLTEKDAKLRLLKKKKDGFT